MWMIKLYLSKIITILFPPHCYGCHKENSSLCAKCLETCRKSIDTPALYITSIYSFQDPLIKKLIHAIKYFHRRDLIEPITRELVKELKATDYLLQATNWVLIPIPMPLIRKYMRGYNQAELIALELSKKCSLSINKKLLVRLSSPKRQVITKTRSERLKNQHNSFKVTDDISGMNIILVDDVTTTGATLTEARDTLLKAGASTVRAVTIAH